MADYGLPHHQRALVRSPSRSPRTQQSGQVSRNGHVTGWFAVLVGMFVLVGVILDPMSSKHQLGSDDVLRSDMRNSSITITIDDVAKFVEATKVTLISANSESLDVIYDDEYSGEFDDEMNSQDGHSEHLDEESSEEYEDDLVDAAR